MTTPGALLAALLCFFAAEPDGRLTRPEQTDYKETSSYADVMAFLDRLAKKPGPIALTTIGKSTGGHPIPLAIVSSPKVESAAEARRAGKLVVYIQANIHAGEVEGKEAALMLLREISENPKPPWLDKCVLLVAPIYNIDGNEKWGDGPRVRPSQNGPGKIGQRENGQGLDLNRDGMKAETPEMRAVLKNVYNAWDPEVSFDLHTTNGTRHGYELTYSPPLNPDTDAGVLAFSRDELLPAVRARLSSQYKLFDYGNLQGRGEKRGWYTFGDEGRYVTNYIGLRNRVAILSEAASFLPFKTRIDSTLAFVKAILDEVAAKSDHVKKMTHDADERVKGWGAHPETAPKLGVRFDFADRGSKESVAIEVVAPGQKVDHLKAPEKYATQDLAVYDRYRTTRTAHFPAGYLLPAKLANVVELLRSHGIAVSRLGERWKGTGDEFLIEGLTSTGTFQRHKMYRLEGKFTSNPQAEAPGGSFFVSTSQPLGILAFLLLEPESLDGVAAWNLLEGSIGEKTEYPIVKLNVPPGVTLERLP